jgi:hypothetical protein
MGLRWLLDDAVTSIRRNWRHPRNFLSAVFILAVGIGTTIGTFDIPYQALHGALPYRHADRIVVAAAADLNQRLYRRDFRPNPSLHTVFEESAAYYTDYANLKIGSTSQRIEIARVSPDFFSTLGVGLLGPGFSTSAPASSSKPAWLPIVISDRLWHTYFASDAGILFRSIELDVDPKRYQVVGIAPPGVSFPPGVDAWAPPGDAWGSTFGSPDPDECMGTIGLLHPGVSVASAEARIRAWPLPPWYNVQPDAKTARLQSLRVFLGAELHRLGTILWVATMFFLALTIAAATGIFQLEIEDRSREFSIKRMLGATRGRLYGSFSVGVGLVLLSAWIASFLVRYALLRVSASYLSLSHLLQSRANGIDVALAASVLAIAFFAALLSQGRSSSDGWGAWLRPRQREKESVKRIARPHAARRTLPVQVTVSAVILITATLLCLSAYMLMRTDPGLDARDVFIAGIALPFDFGWSSLKAPSPKLPPEQRREAREAFFKQRRQLLEATFGLMLQRLATNAAVVSDGVISVSPYRGYPAYGGDAYYSPTPWEPKPGDTTPPPPARVVGDTLARTISPGAIPALGMRLIYGRDFSGESAEQPAVIVNEALAQHLGPGSSALGQYFSTFVFQIEGYPPLQVVGIVGNVHETRLDTPPRPTAYFTMSEFAQPNVDIVVRTSGRISEPDILRLIQASVHAIVPEASVSNFASLSDRVKSAGRLTRYCAYYLLALAWLSIFLAGVCAWTRSTAEIHRRKQEIGVRLAYGAMPRDIVQQVLIGSLALTAIAAAAGVLVAWWFSHLLSHLFYGVRLVDPVSYTVGITIVIAFVLVVQSWSVSNALRQSPSDLLRADTGDSGA